MALTALGQGDTRTTFVAQVEPYFKWRDDKQWFQIEGSAVLIPHLLIVSFSF